VLSHYIAHTGLELSLLSAGIKGRTIMRVLKSFLTHNPVWLFLIFQSEGRDRCATSWETSLVAEKL
jgi:hypothetical protein